MYLYTSDLVNGEIIQLHLNPKNIVSEQTDSSEIIQRFGLYDRKKEGFTLLTKEEIKYPFLLYTIAFQVMKHNIILELHYFLKIQYQILLLLKIKHLLKKIYGIIKVFFDKNSIFQKWNKSLTIYLLKDDPYEKSATLKIKASMFASHWPIIDNTYYYNSLFFGK